MYHVNLPYPPVKVKEENQKYANLILLNYASSVSEFSAITQYVYHETYFKYINAEVSETLEGIAKVEMHHLQMLGEVIILLGGDPGYWIIKNRKVNYWSPDFLSYDKDLKKAISTDIKDEEAAICQYKKTISQIDDSYITDILNRIILDEELHIELLRSLYNKYIK